MKNAKRPMILRDACRTVVLTLICLAAVFAPARGPAAAGLMPGGTAADCPPVPSTITFSYAYGTVQIDGSPAPEGTVVEASNSDGDVVGCIKVSTAGHYGAMLIYGEDTSVSPSIPGMKDGEPVTFHVGGSLAAATPELLWSADSRRSPSK